MSRLPLSFDSERVEAVEHESTDSTKHGSSEATFPAIRSRGNGRAMRASNEAGPGRCRGPAYLTRSETPGAGARLLSRPRSGPAIPPASRKEAWTSSSAR